MKRIIILYFLILINIFLFSTEEGIFVFNEIFICPVGWNSEEEIEIARDKLDNINILNTVAIDQNKYIFSSPISGTITEIDDFLIIENNEYKILYQKVYDFTKLKTNHVNKGDDIISYEKTIDEPFIVFLRNKYSTFPYIKFENGYYKIREIKGKLTNVFSIRKGSIMAAPGIIGTDVPFVTLVNNTSIDYFKVIYLDIENIHEKYLAEKISDNKYRGKDIGYGKLFGNSINSKYIRLKIYTGEDRLNPINPAIIYIKVK